MKEEKTIEQALKDAAEQAGAKPEESQSKQQNRQSWQREQKRFRKEKNTNGNYGRI